MQQSPTGCVGLGADRESLASVGLGADGQWLAAGLDRARNCYDKLRGQSINAHDSQHVITDRPGSGRAEQVASSQTDQDLINQLSKINKFKTYTAGYLCDCVNQVYAGMIMSI